MTEEAGVEQGFNIYIYQLVKIIFDSIFFFVPAPVPKISFDTGHPTHALFLPLGPLSRYYADGSRITEGIVTVKSTIFLQLFLFPGSNLFNRFGRDKSKTQISRVF